MPTPFESAQLNLQLFDLRREPVLREARSWFLLDFHPETLAEFVAAITGERNASIRMVLGYWDMAASLVTTGAIDGDAFRAAHGDRRACYQAILENSSSLTKFEALGLMPGSYRFRTIPTESVGLIEELGLRPFARRAATPGGTSTP